MPMMLTFGLSCAIAPIAAITPAPPHMSYFISCMFSAGLIEMPPESNVRPLPTSASFSFDSGIARVFHARSCGASSSLPRETPRIEPMPLACISASPSAWNVRPYFFAMSSARDG